MKRISLALISAMLIVICLGCGASKYNGTYRDYFINNEVVKQYYSITLKSGKYTLTEVKEISTKTTTPISSGQYEVDKEGKITFTDTSGKSFSGTITSTYLDFTRNGIEYSMKKQ